MKKLVSLLLISAALLTTTVAEARNINDKVAREVAAYYMTLNGYHGDVDASDLVLVRQFDNLALGIPAAWCFNVSDWGWIIVSASTAADPVLGYSEEHNFGEWSELPPNMRWYTNHLVDAVCAVQENDKDKNFDDLEEWTSLLNKTVTPSPKDARRKLIQSEWGQGDEYHPTFNLYCPRTDDGRYSMAGCVATAMVQIMKYFEYPVSPSGQHRYRTDDHHWLLSLDYDTIFFDYSLMPNKVYYNTTPANKIQEVAKLSYAAGVSVDMNYDPDGSGTQSAKVPTAMKNYFHYTMGTLYYRDDMGGTAFVDSMRNQLIRQRILYMSGASSTGSGADAAGHAWICGGYRVDNPNMYYMNWGWDGSADDWFNLVSNNMASSMGYNFKLRQATIINMVPPHADSTSVDFNTGIGLVEDNTVLKPAYPNPAVLNVTLPYSVSSVSDLTVYSVDGRLVATRRLQPGEGSVVLNVADMPAGIYLYRLGGKSGKFMVR